MKIQHPFFCALLSLPMLTCANERTISRLLQAVTSEPLSLAFSITAFDGMKNVDIHDPSSPAPLHQAQDVRKLQLTDACRASYIELFENEALNETFTAYLWNYDEATIAAFPNCMDDGANGLTCAVYGPIEGETRFRSACTAAGGEMFPIEFDLSCDGTLDEEASSVVVDQPSLLMCVPASADFDSCEDGFGELAKHVVDSLAAWLAASITAEGFSDVSCSIGEVEGKDGGPSDAAAPQGFRLASTLIAMICLSLLLPYH